MEKSFGKAARDSWLPALITHWTQRGTFRITREWRAGPEFSVLYMGDAFLGLFALPGDAAGALARGEFDKSLGFKVGDLGVPPSIHGWNMLS